MANIVVTSFSTSKLIDRFKISKNLIFSFAYPFLMMKMVVSVERGEGEKKGWGC